MTERLRIEEISVVSSEGKLGLDLDEVQMIQIVVDACVAEDHSQMVRVHRVYKSVGSLGINFRPPPW